MLDKCQTAAVQLRRRALLVVAWTHRCVAHDVTATTSAARRDTYKRLSPIIENVEAHLKLILPCTRVFLPSVLWQDCGGDVDGDTS
jgi:hypothetical protein